MGDDPCRSASVKQVTIESVSDTNVSFSTRSASRTGDPHECLLRTFTVSRADVDMTPGKAAPPPVELKPGNTGLLYLTRAGWTAMSADGFAIHGSAEVALKVPDCAAGTARLLPRLTVVPTSIVVRGHLAGELEFFDLELLGPDAADAQAIHWNSANYLDVRLSSRGARRLRLKSRSTAAKIWPIAIRIKGSPAFDLAVSGEVDLLSAEMAEGPQEVAYAKPRRASEV